MKKPMTPSYGWGKRVMWLAAIWLGSTAALGLAAWCMRVLMRAVGMSS